MYISEFKRIAKPRAEILAEQGITNSKLISKSCRVINFINGDKTIKLYATDILQFKGGKIIFSCPNKHNHHFKSDNPTATFIPNSDKINCLICGIKLTSYDVIRLLEPEKKNKSDAELTEYLISELQLEDYKYGNKPNTHFKGNKFRKNAFVVF